MIPEECVLVPGSSFEAGVNPQGSQVKLYSARKTAEVRHTRNARNPLPEFCKSLKIEDNIIVRIADEEREINPDEEYFIARIEEKAKKLKEGGFYSAEKYKKGDWIVKIRWYVFCPSKTNRRGDRFYKKGYSQWIDCGSIVKEVASKHVKMRWSGRHYQLSKEDGKYIEDYGNLFG